MTIEQLKTKVEEELNSRGLKSKARFYALDKVIPFIKDFFNFIMFSKNLRNKIGGRLQMAQVRQIA